MLPRVLPLAGFAALATLLYLGFTLKDPTQLPSALIGKPFPAFQLPLLDGEGQATETRLRGAPRLVNVWATWCPTCLAEHGELLRIGDETGLAIVGINYKDDVAKARAWLARHGNPYEFSVVDEAGDLGVELGVYGAPETFLIDASGVIRYKRVGEVNRQVWEAEIEPALRLLSKGPAVPAGAKPHA